MEKDQTNRQLSLSMRLKQELYGRFIISSLSSFQNLVKLYQAPSSRQVIFFDPFKQMPIGVLHTNSRYLQCSKIRFSKT